jgi:transposase-like protein
MTSGICPKCGSQRIHRSHRRGAGEHVLSICGLKSRRCHECNTRFVTLGSSTLFRNDVDRLFRKLSVVLLAAVALVAVVSIVLWLSRREANPSTSAALPSRAAPTAVQL